MSGIEASRARGPSKRRVRPGSEDAHDHLPGKWVERVSEASGAEGYPVYGMSYYRSTILGEQVPFYGPINPDCLRREKLTVLRKLAKRMKHPMYGKLPGHFGAMAPKAVLMDVLAARHDPDEWVLDGNGQWSLVEIGEDGLPVQANESGASESAAVPSDEAASDPVGGLLQNVIYAATVNTIKDRVDNMIQESAYTQPIKILRPDGSVEIEVESSESEVIKDLVRMDGSLPYDQRNYLLVGPAGSGKTTLARRFAKVLDVEFGALSCSAGVSESALLGRVRPFAEPKNEYAASDFVRRYTEGGVFLADELDACDPNLVTGLNAAIDNGILTVPLAGKIFERHENFRFIGAMNTWGTGPDAMYVGRYGQDAAALDRYEMRMIYVDYDRALERRLAEAILEGRPADVDRLLRWIEAIRDRIQTHRIGRVCSTRAVITGARFLASGHTFAEISDKLFRKWTEDELSKVEDLVVQPDAEVPAPSSGTDGSSGDVVVAVPSGVPF